MSAHSASSLVLPGILHLNRAREAAPSVAWGVPGQPE